ncbi:MAG: GGDEF domain-containing protein [Acidobacteria bacterium]|nr:GGDEF domain-containing protein [Acidobacteriota bacterium]
MSTVPNTDRQDLARQVSALAGRDLQLWMLGFLVMLVLASGILCFALPDQQTELHLQLRYVPQVSMGLIALVVLLNVYLMKQRREGDSLRHELLRRLTMDEASEQLSILDPVTQVFRRSYLGVLIDRELVRANREGVPISFMRVRHSDFHQLLERHGEEQAQQFAADVANVLQQNFRGADRIVRYGDSEFLVIMTGTSRRDSEHARRRLQEYVDRWNLHSQMPMEMCLLTSSAEYRAGMDAFQVVAELTQGAGPESRTDSAAEVSLAVLP